MKDRHHALRKKASQHFSKTLCLLYIFLSLVFPKINSKTRTRCEGGSRECESGKGEKSISDTPLHGLPLWVTRAQSCGGLRGAVWVQLSSVPSEDQKVGGLTHWQQSQAEGCPWGQLSPSSWGWPLLNQATLCLGSVCREAQVWVLESGRVHVHRICPPSLQVNSEQAEGLQHP